MRVVHLLVGLGLSFSLAACGGGDGDPVTPPDGGTPPDGEGSGAEECGEEPGIVYTVTPPWQVDFEGGEAGTNTLFLTASVDGSSDNVLLSVDLYEAVVGVVGGALAEGIVPGTFPLEGVDLDLLECSICVYADGQNNSWEAAGGALTIEEIDLVVGGAFRMSLTGITLAGVDFNEQVLPDCTVSLADTTIEGVLVDPSQQYNSEL